MSERSATVLPSRIAHGPTSTVNGRTTTPGPITTAPFEASMTQSGPMVAVGSIAIGWLPKDCPSSGRRCRVARGARRRSSSMLAAIAVVMSHGADASRASTVWVGAGSARASAASRLIHPATNCPSAVAWTSPSGTRAAAALSSRPFTTRQCAVGFEASGGHAGMSFTIRAVDSATSGAIGAGTRSAAARRPTTASMRSRSVPSPARSSKAARRSVSGPKAPSPSSRTTRGSALCSQCDGEVIGAL